MGNPDLGYIPNIEPRREQTSSTGKSAEETVINFFKQAFPNMEVRTATAKEDHGMDEFATGKAVDAIAYLDKKPALGLQITTTESQQFISKKINEMQKQPFLRLEEMKTADPAIPRALIYLDAKEVQEFSKDKNFDMHPKLGRQILDSTVKSLQFDLLKTSNQQEISRLQSLLQLIHSKQTELETKERGKPQ